VPLNEENEIKINNKNKSSAGEPRTAGEKLKRELDEIASPKGIPDLDYASYFEKLKGRVKAKPKAKAKNKAKAQAHDFADVVLRLEPEQEPQENLEPAPELEAEVIEEPQELQEQESEHELEQIAEEPEQVPDDIILPKGEQASQDFIEFEETP